MANGETPELEPTPDIGDVVLTEAGAVPREVFELRQQAGTAAEEISEIELLERRRAELVEQTEDAPITTGLERFASAATLGAFDVLAGEEESESRRRRIEANPFAATIGEVTGAVLPSLLAPGAGAAGAFARLTPQGRLAAMGAKFASGGRAGASKFARLVGAGAFEGAAEGLGNAGTGGRARFSTLTSQTSGAFRMNRHQWLAGIFFSPARYFVRWFNPLSSKTPR